MRKLRLDTDALQVESFTSGESGAHRGTVQGYLTGRCTFDGLTCDGAGTCNGMDTCDGAATLCYNCPREPVYLTSSGCGGPVTSSAGGCIYPNPAANGRPGGGGGDLPGAGAVSGGSRR